MLSYSEEIFSEGKGNGTPPESIKATSRLPKRFRSEERVLSATYRMMEDPKASDIPILSPGVLVFVRSLTNRASFGKERSIYPMIRLKAIAASSLVMARYGLTALFSRLINP